MCNNCNTLTNDLAPAVVHVFQAAGLGIAPFTFKEVQYDTKGTHCDFCGTAIVNVFWVGSADGKRFKVGCDCIEKSGDHALIKVVDGIIRRHERLKRAAKAKFIFDELVTLMADPAVIASAQAVPHPNGWQKNYRWMKDAATGQSKYMGDPANGHDYLLNLTRRWASASEREKAYRFIKFGFKVPPKGARLADVIKK